MADPNKVLIAFDGSANAMRAVDYAARLFGPQKSAEVTLCGVHERAPIEKLEGEAPGMGKLRQSLLDLEIEREQVRERMNQASQALVGSGMDIGRVHVKHIEKKTNVPKDLLTEIAEGGYGTVVVGRRGSTDIRDFIFGRVSSTLVNNLQGRTVIVVE